MKYRQWKKNYKKRYGVNPPASNYWKNGAPKRCKNPDCKNCPFPPCKKGAKDNE
ncbi:hypothetical protein HGO97_014425 [Faecalicatena sp. AGMB00832]|uniref:Uncharacterized protein n=1 Tax=Faecalicatena faecalis TaxID=2726362 RepID=A0ABS6D5X9_9FIRM|nr:hypothetical protein [Faecalicatena faecalis]MBU3877003.1 hypothetical protein [Faecalicatena faecalis]